MSDLPAQDFDRYRTRLYREALSDLLGEGILRRDSRVLVVCAGSVDAEVFRELGFTRVTLSNLASNTASAESGSYEVRCLDAEALECADGEYEFCVVHAGLHHCASPQRAILEMYRVARVGLLAVEPRDSLLGRVLVRLGFGQEYEVASAIDKVASHGGGLRFGGIPNFVYRFTRREVVKCIETHSPYAPHRYRFIERLMIPWNRYRKLRFGPVRLVAGIARPFAPLLERLPFLANLLAFAVVKPRLPEDAHPWLRAAGGDFELDPEWVRRHYQGSLEG